MNIITILISAAVCFIIGFLFHGPLFGKVWMKLANITPTGNEKFSDMWKQMLWNYIGCAVTAAILSMMIWIASYSTIMGIMTWYKGAIIGAWLWLGFVAVWTSMDVIWMKKSFKLWLFDSVSFLVSIAVMGAILAA